MALDSRHQEVLVDHAAEVRRTCTTIKGVADMVVGTDEALLF